MQIVFIEFISPDQIYRVCNSRSYLWISCPDHIMKSISSDLIYDVCKTSIPAEWYSSADCPDNIVC